MALITTATVKTLLGITAGGEDTKLDLLCNYVDAGIKDYIGLDIEATTYPGAATNGKGDGGYYSGDDSRFLITRQRPIRTVTALHLDPTGRWDQNPDGSFATATLLTAGTDYAIRYDGYAGMAAVSNCGIIERIGQVWPALYAWRRGAILPDQQEGQGNIKVAYTGGWSTVPPAITQAAALWVSYMRRIQPQGGNVVSESMGSYSYSVAPMRGLGIPDDVVRLLAPYRELRL